MLRHQLAAGIVLGVAVSLLSGCGDRPTLFQNPDPSLRKTRTELSADAHGREYHFDAPQAMEPKARAQAAYMLKRLEIVNFTGKDWEDVEVWVNRQYVCYVPKVEDRKLKEIHFPMLYNQAGAHFPYDNRKEVVKTVEVYRDGKMYQIVCHNADF